MRIDSHQHFWRYSPDEYGWLDSSMAKLRRDFLPLHLKPELDLAGFEGCIAVQARQSVEETRWLLELGDVSPYIVGVILFVVGVGIVLTFRVSRFFFPRAHRIERAKTQYVDAWSESARRLQMTSDDQENE